MQLLTTLCLEAGTNILASVGANAIGTLRGSSEAPEITPDGRFVAFCSTATNLVAGITGTMDVYVRDLVARTTVWASTGARAALQAAFHLPGAASFNHAVSADGGVVAYEATPSVSGPGLYPGGGLVLRYHVDSGATDVVYTNAYVPAGAYELTRSLAMTPDGRFIAFVANTNGNSGATTCIRLWDALAFASAPKLVSGGTNNLVATNTTASWPALDASGRYVAFLSNGTNFVTNSLVGAYHLYLRDMQADTTQLFDADDNGIGSPLSPAAGPSLSADDRVVAFECIEANLAPNDRNHDCDVFARDLHAGTTELISVHDPALASVTANGAASVAAESVSFDGRLVAYASEADNLTPNLLGGRNIFVRDLVAGTNVLVSVATNGASGDGTSSEPAISPDGRYVGFTSRADNLVAADTNQAQDVFVRDLVAGTTVLVSVNMNGTGPGNADSYSPRISSGGRYVLFQSRANNLAPGSGGLSDSLFLRDLRGRVTYRLTGSGAPANKLAAMTPDGHFVLYVDAVSLYAFYVAVWDSQLGGRIYSNSLTTTPFTVPFTGLAISAGGQRLAFCFNSGSGRALTTVDLGTGGATVVESSATSYHQGLQLSADGRFLAAIRSTTTLNTNQIYLYDLQTGTNVLVSQSGVSGGPANGASDSPGLSPDGRLVAYRSAASDLVTGDGNGVPDVFVYDTQTVTTTLLSAGGNRSLRPVFSGDGRTLVFESWAADLAAQDFNHASDIFAYALQSVGPTPLFRAMVLPGAPGQALWITWPTVAGKSYRAQFKDNLTDATWQDLPSQIRLLGSQGYLADPGAGSGQRFYRIVEF